MGEAETITTDKLFRMIQVRGEETRGAVCYRPGSNEPCGVLVPRILPYVGGQPKYRRTVFCLEECILAARARGGGGDMVHITREQLGAVLAAVGAGPGPGR